MKLDWRQQGQDHYILSAPISVNGSANTYDKWLRRVRRASLGGWYVQRKHHAGWRAMQPRIAYDTLDLAKVAAQASVRPEELA